MIVLDAAAVPDGFSGARTRLRGLLGAYGRLSGAPPLVVRLARGARLLDGIELGAVKIVEAPAPGGPLRRALLPGAHAAADGPLGRARLWHSETIPPLAPRGVPSLLTIHDLRWSEPREVTGAPLRKWWPRHVGARLWLPRLAQRIAGIVTVSSASARSIETRLCVPADRIHVIENASDGEPLAPRLDASDESALLARLGVSDAPFLLAVGHLEPRKGLGPLLEVLAGAPSGSALARVALVLVGAGPSESELRRQAQELALAPRVRFAGALDERSTASLYSHAAALVFPSRFEGFGFPVHEALARGCPVVARRLAVLADAPDPRVELVDGDAHAWAAALERKLQALPGERRASSSERPMSPRSWTWSDAAGKLAALYARWTAAHEGAR